MSNNHAKIMALHVEAMEINCFVEGMVAENQTRVQNGETPAYDETQFAQCTDILERIREQMGDILNAED